MYYDNKNGIIINKLPKNSIGLDGQLYINFDAANNVNLWADHNYFTIRNDGPIKPSENYEEDISKRIIVIDYPYIDITRTWIINEIPAPPINHNLPIQPEENIDTEL